MPYNLYKGDDASGKPILEVKHIDNVFPDADYKINQRPIDYIGTANTKTVNYPQLARFRNGFKRWTLINLLGRVHSILHRAVLSKREHEQITQILGILRNIYSNTKKEHYILKEEYKNKY